MNTAPIRPAFHGPRHGATGLPNGATALGKDSTARPTRPQHRLRRTTRDACRAVRVFAGAAFGVVVLGTGTDSGTASTGTDSGTASTGTDTGTGTGTGAGPGSAGSVPGPYRR